MTRRRIRFHDAVVAEHIEQQRLEAERPDGG
jgi:hypothetical protein